MTDPSTTDRHGAHAATASADDAGLGARLEAIAAALDGAGSEVDPALAAAARDDIARIEQRLALGIGWTVAALVGGTGSGKSSLFNAVSGLSFADVGAIRPTTERAAACVWGGTATELLDFLAVADQRRIRRESTLDADHERALHGLVLLDMPDHDSVAREHADQVDRLLPLVDLLIWVVDPQKYADNVLHERYLRALVDRQDAMLVLVNQADTIPESALPRVVESVRGLLREGGLDAVEVLPTSAMTGAGVEDVREVLARTVARSSVSARTAQAEIEAVSRRLGAAVAPAEPPLGDTQIARATEELARAAGIGAVADSLRHAAVRVRPSALSAPQPPATGTVEAVRGRWLSAATSGLPERWQRAVDRDVAGTEELRSATAEAVGAVPLPEPRHRGALALHAAGLALAGLGVVLVVLGLVGVSNGGLPGGPLLPAGGAMVLLGAVALVAARVWRGSRAEHLAAEYREDVTGRVREVVRRELAAPTTAVLERHRVLRHALTEGAPQRG